MTAVTHLNTYGFLGRRRDKAVPTHTGGLNLMPDGMNLRFHNSNFDFLNCFAINASAFLTSDCEFILQSPFH